MAKGTRKSVRKKPARNERIEPVFSDSPARKPSGSQKKPAGKTPARSTARRKRKKPRKPGLIRRWVARSVYWSLVAGVWITLAALAVIAWHAMQLPHSSVWAVPDRPPNARIVSADGELIANRGVTGGAAISLGDMSPYIPMAVIAIEDRRFKHHFGVDPIGLARAMSTNVMARRFVQGGSTLTQQLAKNLFLKPERTLSRKIQEAILAMWLEFRFTKDEILELYLNRVYFGSGSYGVDAAARRYFGKSASDVNLAEAAILAGVLKAPSRLSPARNPKLSRARSKLVLAAMRQQGFITDRQSATALKVQAKKAKRYLSGSKHYVADMVMKQLPSLVGKMDRDLIITTTIDDRLQTEAGKIIETALRKSGKHLKVSQGALVSFDAKGGVRALVGGREYAESQFNRAVDAKRQPGSTFKTFVYLASLEAGRTPDSVRNDAPVRIGKWQPVNYDRKYRGDVTLAQALALSLNTVAAQLVMETGPNEVIDVARRLGIRSKMSKNASIALGTSETSLFELTAAYVSFANGGFRISPHLIERITDTEGNILYERKSAKAKRIIREREVGMINDMLRIAMEQGTGKNARLNSWIAAGKTGTSQNSRDGWFVGYTKQLTTGIWFGNDDGSATNKLTGGGLPARTWRSYMHFAHKGLKPQPLPFQFAPLISAVPQTRPNFPIPGSRRNDNRTAQQQFHKKNTSQQVTGGIRPGQDVGPTDNKPKSILDLIFRD